MSSNVKGCGTQLAARMVPNMLSIAGTDPSGGAGIQADLKTFAACGAYGMAVTTAIVAQNTCAVRRVRVLDAGLVSDQLEAVFDDVRVDGVKLGMLGSAAVARRVARVLRQRAPPLIVLDPVLCSSTGTRLLSWRALDVVLAELLPLATVITPNLREAEILLGKRAGDDTAGWMEAAAIQLRRLGPAWVLLKGGHRADGRCADVLAGCDGVGWMESPRVAGNYGHGTGCTLSAALATAMTMAPVRSAAAWAKQYLFQALLHAAQLDVGRGPGPLHHAHGCSGSPPVVVGRGPA
ncbi:bifunctional hydroxymethylpyrimidine kinase/phosphomethylpyrimidine kinase [Frateuria aurantia]